MQLLPIQAGLKATLWIRPFTDQGPYYQPGQGRTNIIALIDVDGTESRHKASRDLTKEKENAQNLLDHCLSLQGGESQHNEWHIDSLEGSLELLTELESYKEQQPLSIEWPQGQPLTVKKKVSSKDLTLSIRSNQQWFEYEGEIALDDNQVLQMKSLLDLLDNSPGRFVEIGKGQFIELTDKFKKQLDELRTVSEGNQVFHLGAGNLMDIASDAAELQCDADWNKHIKKMASMKKHRPQLPSTLQAELRDYQQEGFHYLSRLSHWGIGSCLADDMGLGKTVQAIALLLEKAVKGPSLVIAPTSVCFNWLEECSKFAPTLNMHTLQVQDREAVINNLKAMDVLVCSYGLLLQQETVLMEKAWQVIVIDEAQAIKNPATKRWKSVMQLKSNSRVALTGTPIENHLGELWSIFRFLNPGLLGSLKHFQARFSGPIENYNDATAKRTLKKLVQPFILRRLKTNVLDELPAKTEQTITIEPSSEESAFYEALRIQALEKMAQAPEGQGSKRFAILAAITRLRQACCHTALIQQEIAVDSSKTKTFLTLIKNLLDNNHKVLVFSQYVRYLNIIKIKLEQENIHYQYLDGQTAPKMRQKAVTAFQAGEGDVFLLSLKAGGTGLNLTAADYVIHLDPWWNPAVEDQASDRAHRIGQQRPVTVYRLIVKDSIEEKIIHLHKNKRDLADDLLGDGHMSGKMSEKELMALMAG